MTEIRRRVPPVILILLTILVCLPGCAHKKAFKRGQEAESAGRFVEAAEKYLEALDKKPEYEDAKEQLRLVAPRAYEQLVRSAEAYEADGEWISASKTWQHNQRFLARCRRHGVVMETEDVAARITRAVEQGREYYYDAGLEHFSARRYLEAIEEFKNVLTIGGHHYRDTKQKLWEAYIRLGDDRLLDREYQAALEYYSSALDYADDEPLTKEYISETYYQWAEDFAKNEDYRQSTEHFERCLQYTPGYRDAEEKREAAYQKALVRVAVLPFESSTTEGAGYSGMLGEELINACIKANLKYAVFITRSSVDQILEEYRLAAAGVVDEDLATRMGKLEGIHYFITGKLTHIAAETGEPSCANRTHDIQYTATDANGVEIQKTRRISYRECSEKRTVRVSASYQIVAVETGRMVKGNNFTRPETSEAHWVLYQGNPDDLPQDKRGLVGASQEPNSVDAMTTEVVHGIAQEMSGQLTEHFR